MYMAWMSEGKMPNAEEYRLLQFLWEKACLFVCGVSLEGRSPPSGGGQWLPQMLGTAASGKNTGPGLEGDSPFLVDPFGGWIFFFLPYTCFEVFISKEKEMKTKGDESPKAAKIQQHPLQPRTVCQEPGSLVHATYIF